MAIVDHDPGAISRLLGATDSARLLGRQEIAPVGGPMDICRRRRIADAVPGIAKGLVAAALGGDRDAVLALLCFAPPAVYPDIILALFDAGVPLPVFQEVLRHAWRGNHYALLNGLGRQRMRQLFAYGGTRPADLPERVTVWRGGNAPLSTLRQGVSWTTDREVAAAFALFTTEVFQTGAPLVLRGTTLGARVLHTDFDRPDPTNLSEIVVFGIRNVAIDGEVADYCAAFQSRIVRFGGDLARFEYAVHEQRARLRGEIPERERAAIGHLARQLGRPTLVTPPSPANALA